MEARPAPKAPAPRFASPFDRHSAEPPTAQRAQAAPYLSLSLSLKSFPPSPSRFGAAAVCMTRMSGHSSVCLAACLAHGGPLSSRVYVLQPPPRSPPHTQDVDVCVCRVGAPPAAVPSQKNQKRPRRVRQKREPRGEREREHQAGLLSRRRPLFHHHPLSARPA